MKKRFNQVCMFSENISEPFTKMVYSQNVTVQKQQYSIIKFILQC